MLSRFFVIPLFFFSTVLLSQPSVEFSSNTISVEANTSDDVSATLTITNSGDSDLNWSAEVSGDAYYELDLYEGTTTSASTTTLSLTNASTDNPIGGTYESNIRFITNDPVNAITDIAVTIVLTGTPSITFVNLESETLDFGSVMAFTSDTIEVLIENSGDDNLILDGITTTAYFGSNLSSLTIPANSQGTGLVIFTPDDAGTFTDVITVTTNDPAVPTAAFNLTGLGFTPPVISIDQSSLTSDITTGETETQAISITNSGGSVLLLTTDFKDPNLYPYTFTKNDYADWTLEENQDRITNTVWLTRQNNNPIYNAAIQDCYYCETHDGHNYDNNNTEWHPGPTSEADPNNYMTFRDAKRIGDNMIYEGDIFSLHVIDEDRYFDFTFHSWTSNGQGGGFSYTRVEVNPDSWIELSSGEGLQEPEIDFAKDDYADYNLENSQDRVTDQVWITRANNQGLFNAYNETSYDLSTSPDGTLWRWGGNNVNNENEWTNWEDAVNQSGYSVRYALSQEYLWGGTPLMSMHVEGTDLFMIFFLHHGHVVVKVVVFHIPEH